MTDSTWLNLDHQLVPGKELFRSERAFHLWSYTASHGQLLMRSGGDPEEPGEPDTTIDLLFKPAAVVKIRSCYRGLVIRCATETESERVEADHPSVHFGRDEHVFVLESQGESDFVVAMAVGWREGVLGRTQMSFFHDFPPPGRPSGPAGPSRAFTPASTRPRHGNSSTRCRPTGTPRSDGSVTATSTSS
ncbi:hypothetical protein [Streptomyces sp. NPDC048606]|uniref:hypothetical protein n=1 Tax=Streptomyces sp. NPDC048606 TaxID=3154726 RepID=UPI003444AFE5